MYIPANFSDTWTLHNEFERLETTKPILQKHLYRPHGLMDIQGGYQASVTFYAVRPTGEFPGFAKHITSHPDFWQTCCETYGIDPDTPQPDDPVSYLLQSDSLKEQAEIGTLIHQYYGEHFTKQELIALDMFLSQAFTFAVIDSVEVYTIGDAPLSLNHGEGESIAMPVPTQMTKTSDTPDLEVSAHPDWGLPLRVYAQFKHRGYLKPDRLRLNGRLANVGNECWLFAED